MTSIVQKQYRFITFSLLFFCFFLLKGEIFSQDLFHDEESPVQAEFISEFQEIQPGQEFWVAVKLKMADGWHTYWKNPGEAGFAPEVSWSLPDGFIAGDLHWPAPMKFEAGGLIGFGYEKEVLLLTRIQAPLHLEEKQSVSIQADVSWLACHEACIPGQETLHLQLPVVLHSPEASSSHAKTITEALALLPQQSTQKVWVEKKGKHLVLHPPQEEGLHWDQAYFIPNDPEFTDLARSQTSHQEKGLRIETPEELQIAQLGSIKGLLVLQRSGDDSSFQALEVEFDTNAHLSNLSSSEEELSHLGFALLFAFLGGLILNLMPCVLPVISLKIMSFLSMAGESRKKIFEHGVAFTLGVLVSFWILTAALLALRSYGELVGWGFQLQNPGFVAVLATILFLLGLNLFGVFEFGMNLASGAGGLEQKAKRFSGDILGSFFSGVLATAVATPCTGPFLGTALGYALSHSNTVAMSVFTSMALGLSFPYLFLSIFPQFVRYIPKPGPWMVIFRELMGFLMMATVLWLCWVFATLTSTNGLLQLLGALLSISVAAWMYGRWILPGKRMGQQIMTYGIIFCVGILGCYAAFQAAHSVDQRLASMEEQRTHDGWEPFSLERLKELQASHTPVFVDFTAKWCMICQFNQTAFHSKNVDQRFKELGIVRMEADWTRRSPEITQTLESLGRSGVPVYALYGVNPGEPPSLLPQTLTPDIVLQYLDELEDKSIAENTRK